MNKPQLTPFDYDLIAMVRNLTPHVDVSQYEENQETFILHWSLDEANPELRKAILEAIKGRLGERHVETTGTRVNATIIKYDPESWPEENRYDLTDPDESIGWEFTRSVKAVKFINNESIDLIVDFVGGGTHTIPKHSGVSTFEFPNQDGLNTKVNEGDYVVLENGIFSVMQQKEFEKLYKPNI